MTNQLIIASTPIPVDSDQRINLNALHRASGLDKAKQPSNWLRLVSTKELINELSNSSDLRSSPVFKSEGCHGGTFAHQLLAISYAGWISPAFQLQVNQVFLHSKIRAPQPEPLLNENDMVINKDKYITLLEQTLALLQIEQKKEQHKAKRKPATPLSVDEINSIHKMKSNGFSQNEIAQSLNRSAATISYVLRSDSLQGGAL